MKNKSINTAIGNISDFVADNLSETKDFLLLISPFIKRDALEKILGDLAESPSKLVVVARWLPEDLLVGVSDISVYELVKSCGGEMLINSDIHLKVYISDYKTVLLGSANLTQKGIGLSIKHNIEALTKIACNEEILEKIRPILDSSIKLNDEIVNMFAGMVDKFSSEYNKSKNEELGKYYLEIKDVMVNSEHGLFVHNFPLTSSPTELLDILDSGVELDTIENDMNLFDFDSREQLQKSFLKSKAYQWQKDNIIEPTLFGKYSELLHNSLSDIPKPYRKVVKDLVLNMYNWTKEFSNEFEFEKKNHTEVIKPKSY